MSRPGVGQPARSPTQPLLEELAAVGESINHYRSQMATMTARRQELIRILRAKGVPLKTCAKVAGVTPEAITVAEKRRQQSSK